MALQICPINHANTKTHNLRNSWIAFRLLRLDVCKDSLLATLIVPRAGLLFYLISLRSIRIMPDGTRGIYQECQGVDHEPKSETETPQNRNLRCLRLHQTHRVVLVHQRLVHDLLVQRLARGDHREDVLICLDHALEQDGPVVVVLEELLHLRRQLRRTRHPDRMYAHRARERDEVRVRHARVRVPRAVEQI